MATRVWQSHSPCKAMDQLVVARVAQWRATHGVQQDEDFASDFCSFEEAALVAGPEVAGAWQQSRTRAVDGASLALVHSAAVAGSQAPSSSRPPLPRRYKPMPAHGRIKQHAAVGPPKEGITRP